jgi:hypothetical protein
MSVLHAAAVRVMKLPTVHTLPADEPHAGHRPAQGELEYDAAGAAALFAMSWLRCPKHVLTDLPIASG